MDGHISLAPSLHLEITAAGDQSKPPPPMGLLMARRYSLQYPETFKEASFKRPTLLFKNQF